jgi:ribosomal protein L24
VRQSVRHLGPKGRKSGAKSTGKTEGQRVSFNAPIRVENVALVHEKTVGRVGYKKEGDKKVRVLRTKKGVQEIG